MWDAIIASHPSEFIPKPTDEKEKDPKVEQVTINVLSWVTRATIDIIGLAGFDYHFRSLEDETEEVYMAFKNMFMAADKGTSSMKLLGIYFPIFNKLIVSVVQLLTLALANFVYPQPTEVNRTINESVRTIQRVGKQIIASKKAAIQAELKTSKEMQRKDILSLLSAYGLHGLRYAF